MERIRIVVPAEPGPLARPRFSGRHCYQPKRNVEYRAVVQQAARSAMGGRKPLSGEVSAVIKLYRRYKPTARNYGDCDNHAKAIFDGLNQIAFEDDRQIVRCFIAKFTDKGNPRAEIELETFSPQAGEFVLLAEAKLGELFNQMPKTSGGDHGNQYTSGKIPPAGKFGNSEPESEEEPPPKPKPKLERHSPPRLNDMPRGD